MKIVLLGAPGSGKGTQATIISKKFSIPHISTGEMIRSAISSKSDLGLKVESIVKSGGLISDDLVSDLVVNRVKEEDCKNGYILDGFPRTITQCNFMFDNKMHVDFVINIDLKTDSIVSRISGRRMHVASGRCYHISENKPKIEGLDDETGEKLIQRDDDKEEVVKVRITKYKEQANKIVDFYKTKTKSSYLKVDGNSEIKVVSKSIIDFIENTK